MIKNIFLFLLLSYSSLSAQNYFAGGGIIYCSPTGTLSNRVEGNFGGLIYWGEKISGKFNWRLKAEYFETSKPNSEKLSVRIESDINNQTKQFTFPLKNLQMKFSYAGLAAEGNYKFFDAGAFNAELVFGFGFYHWEHLRGGYSDSLFVDTTGAGNFLLVKKINLQPLAQKDWSGGLTLGLNFNLNLFEPIAIEFSGNYKLLIAELWPSLAIDLENVSGIQLFDLRAGVKYNF